jgi:glutamate decarboxylase
MGTNFEVLLESLIHPKIFRVGNKNLSLDPIFVREGLKPIPRNELPADSIDPNIAYQIVHDELLLDGNARLNLATILTTWMEPPDPIIHLFSIRNYATNLQE